MKANELMIGDWVYGLYPNGKRYANPFCISAVDTYPTNRSPRIVTVGGYGFQSEHLEPIPLTAEILEKNGFEIVGREKYFLVPGDPSLAIKREPIIGAHGNSFLIGHFFEKKDFRWFIELAYIHELQHALRLCGIEKEIVI